MRCFQEYCSTLDTPKLSATSNSAGSIRLSLYLVAGLSLPRLPKYTLKEDIMIWPNLSDPTRPMNMNAPSMCVHQLNWCMPLSVASLKTERGYARTYPNGNHTSQAGNFDIAILMASLVYPVMIIMKMSAMAKVSIGLVSSLLGFVTYLR